MSVDCFLDTSITRVRGLVGGSGCGQEHESARPRAYGISYRDGAIVAATEALEAPILYTEDLNHGRRYGPVRAVNPFLGT
jgi:predicted nucleic acid-binding protein